MSRRKLQENIRFSCLTETPSIGSWTEISQSLSHLGKVFMSKSDLEAHATCHTRATPHVCHVCQKAFGRLSSLVRHKDVCGFATRQYTCHKCGQAFKAKRYLREHILIHDDPERYQCQSCGDLFSHRASLRKHVDRKHPKRGYWCVRRNAILQTQYCVSIKK